MEKNSLKPKNITPILPPNSQFSYSLMEKPKTPVITCTLYINSVYYKKRGISGYFSTTALILLKGITTMQSLPTVDLVGVNFEHVDRNRPGGKVEIKYNRGLIAAETVSLLMNLPSVGRTSSVVLGKVLFVAGLEITNDFLTSMSTGSVHPHRFLVEGQGGVQELVLARIKENRWDMEYAFSYPVLNRLTIKDGMLRLRHKSGDLPSPDWDEDDGPHGSHVFLSGTGNTVFTKCAIGPGATYYE